MYEGSFSHHTTFSVGIYLKKKKESSTSPVRCESTHRARPRCIYIQATCDGLICFGPYVRTQASGTGRSDDPLNKINLFSFFLLLLFFNHLRDVCSLGDYSRRSTGKLSHIFPQCHLYYIENITCGEITHDTLLLQREEPLFLCIAFNIQYLRDVEDL